MDRSYYEALATPDHAYEIEELKGKNLGHASSKDEAGIDWWKVILAAGVLAGVTYIGYQAFKKDETGGK